MKCIPAWNSAESSVMQMLGRQPIEVVSQFLTFQFILIINMISVFKFCVIWGIFLSWFADALLFDMMIRTDYGEPVNSIDDLIDRDMILSNLPLIIIDKFVNESCPGCCPVSVNDSHSQLTRSLEAEMRAVFKCVLMRIDK